MSRLFTPPMVQLLQISPDKTVQTWNHFLTQRLTSGSPHLLAGVS